MEFHIEANQFLMKSKFITNGLECVLQNKKQRILVNLHIKKCPQANR